MPRLPAPTSPAAHTTSSASSSSQPPPPPSPQLLQITTTANNSASSSSRGGGGGGIGGAQNQACAACKYQRRKCTPDCPLAVYFPADQQQRFINAHRLFGVSNIQKTLRDTDPELHQDAMRALIFQADARAYDLVGGCYRLVLELQIQLRAQLSELHALHTHLDLCRRNAIAMAGAGSLDVDTGMLLAGGDVMTDNQMQPAQHYQHNYFYCDRTAGNDVSVHGQYRNGGGDFNTGSSMLLGEQLEQHCQIDMKPEVKTTTMQHAGNSSIEHLDEEEEKLVPSVVKSEVIHQAAAQMGQSTAAAAAHCQFEMGFSSL